MPKTMLLMLQMTILLLHLHIMLVPSESTNGMDSPLILSVRPPSDTQGCEDAHDANDCADCFPVGVG